MREEIALTKEELLEVVYKLKQRLLECDEVIAQYADIFAKQNLNQGDLTWGNCIAYSPISIRQELSERLDEEYIDSRTNINKFQWALANATEDDLRTMADFILSDPNLWTDYASNIKEGVDFLFAESQAKANK